VEKCGNREGRSGASRENENAKGEENQASTIIVVSDRRTILFKVVQIKPIKQSSCRVKAKLLR